MTNPSRSASNGRDASSGASFRVDIARMCENAPKISGEMGASEPPANITSASPRRTIPKASPIPIAPDAHDTAFARFGPRTSRSMAMLAALAPQYTLRASDVSMERTPF